MNEFIHRALGEAGALPALEAAGALLGVLYLVLAIRESLWCWLCALGSALIFAWLFGATRLYMDAGLQLFYAAMAVYGYRSWRGGGPDSTLSVTRWPLPRHAVALVAIVLASAASGYLLDTVTDAAYPYLDSATTWASLWTTFLVARKVLENWWYWLVIDVVCIGIYVERGLEFAALLFAIYTVLIPFGLLSWWRSMQSDAVASAAGSPAW